jgi:hypothetical protein
MLGVVEFWLVSICLNPHLYCFKQTIEGPYSYNTCEEVRKSRPINEQIELECSPFKPFTIAPAIPASYQK